MLPKSIYNFFFVLFCLLFCQISIAQQNDNTDDQTLNEQYNTLIENSETFNEYKVIKKNTLNDFWKVVSDSVALLNTEKKEALSTVRSKQTQIDALNSTIQTKDKELATGEAEKSNITVLGADISKSLYAIISILIPLALLVVIGFLIVKSKVDLQSTKSAKKDLTTLEEEFKEHKKRAMDNQSKLNRELQTERNKLAELKK